MNYWDKLNKILADSLNDPDLFYELKYFDETSKLAKIIIENTPLLKKEYFSREVLLNDSIREVTNFLYTVKPSYAYMFQNILQEKNDYDDREDYSVKFYKRLANNQKVEYKGQHTYDDSSVRCDGLVRIDYSNTVNDIFVITHEMVHKFSTPKNDSSTIKWFLGEVSTISMEFLLEDYLLQNEKYSSDELRKSKNNRFVNSYGASGAVLCENILVHLYKQNNNCINKDILLNYLDSLDKSSNLYEILSVRGGGYLNDIVDKNSLTFFEHQRYVIGTILASYFHDEIKKDKNSMEKIVYLIDILGHNDLQADNDLKILNNLGIPIISGNEIKISDDNIKKLTDCYKEEIKNNKQEYLIGINK